ncbi:MAG: hypothetical protein ACE366_12270 [Bradymonadia bacterium]
MPLTLPPIHLPITHEDVDQLAAALGEVIPRFAIRYKDESPLQRLIGRLVSPFNSEYMTRFTTVMFGKVYFPSRAWCDEMGPEAVYSILRHEAVHLLDAKHFPVIFHLSYLFLLPAGLTARAWWEWRGYVETMRVEVALRGYVPEHHIEWIAGCFTGPAYLFMWPFPKQIRRALRRKAKQLQAQREAQGSP